MPPSALWLSLLAGTHHVPRGMVLQSNGAFDGGRVLVMTLPSSRRHGSLDRGTRGLDCASERSSQGVHSPRTGGSPR